MCGKRAWKSWRTGTYTVRGDITDMKRVKSEDLLALGVVLTLASLGLCVAGPSRADTVVVTADRMIDVVTGKVVNHPLITVTDGRISAVAAGVGTDGAATPAGARRIDLQGMTLLPGLIDMHTHITADPH